MWEEVKFRPTYRTSARVVGDSGRTLAKGRYAIYFGTQLATTRTVGSVRPASIARTTMEKRLLRERQ